MIKNKPIPRKLRQCLTTALVLGAGVASGGAQDVSRLDKLEKENADLKKRLENIEALATKEGILPKDKVPNKSLKFLADSEISGFVTASYFYDFSKPNDNVPNGYLWTRHNSLSLNKAKLAIQRKAKSGDELDVGYKVAMVWGQDAPFVNTGGAAQGVESLRDAYIEMHVPVGNGLNIKAGHLISLLNWESGDGGVVNANFSQGNQWFYTGNGPAAGVQLGYAFSDQWNLNVRVQNGLYTGLADGNSGKIGMASLGYKPDAKTGINFIGFGGHEPFGQIVGGSILASRQLTEKYNLTLATELDLFSVQTKPRGGQDYWSAGGWLTADITEKLGLALRTDYVVDNDGFATGGVGPVAAFQFPANTGQNLLSVTFTANYKLHPSLKLQPEIRYDRTSLAGGFDGANSRWIGGMGLSYSF